jgi:hypothetical protein
LLDQLSGSQRAIALIKSFKVDIVQFHDGFILCPSFPPKAHGSNSPHPWDAFRVPVSWSVLVLSKSFAILFSGNPKLPAETGAMQGQRSSATTPANFKFGIL